MNKVDVVLYERYATSGYGRCTVIDLMPESKFYVKVKYDLNHGKFHAKFPGQEMNAEVAKMKPLPAPKAKNPRYTFNPKPEIKFAFMGWCAENGIQMPSSVPPEHFQEAWEEVEETQNSNPVGITKKAEGSQGASHDMLITKPPCDLEALGKALGVGLKNFYNNPDAKVVLLYGPRKPWFFHFLIHGFKDGKGPRDVQAIRATVPPNYQPYFDAGARGEFALE